MSRKCLDSIWRHLETFYFLALSLNLEFILVIPGELCIKRRGKFGAIVDHGALLTFSIYI